MRLTPLSIQSLLLTVKQSLSMLYPISRSVVLTAWSNGIGGSRVGLSLRMAEMGLSAVLDWGDSTAQNTTQKIVDTARAAGRRKADRTMVRCEVEATSLVTSKLKVQLRLKRKWAFLNRILWLLRVGVLLSILCAGIVVGGVCGELVVALLWSSSMSWMKVLSSM